MATNRAEYTLAVRFALAIHVSASFWLIEAVETPLSSGIASDFATNPAELSGSAESSPYISNFPTSTTTLIPAGVSEEPPSSGLPVGAWIGIGFALLFLILVGIVWFVGHKRVIEYVVSMKTRASRKATPLPRSITVTDPVHLEPLPVRTSSGHFSKNSHPASTPRTAMTDIPFASVEIDSDGRMSPRLPIASKRGSSLNGTPHSRRSHE